MFKSIQALKKKGKWMILKYNKGNVSIHKKFSMTGRPEDESVFEQKCREEFVKEVQACDPCWGFIDYRGKIFFLSYITENADKKLKMPMAFNRQKLKQMFNGIHYDLECTEAGDVEPDAFDGKL